MNLVFAGVVLLALYFYNEWAIGLRSVRARAASILPLLRRLNIAVAICGVAAIVVGLLSLRL